jgi:hypothetical protein
MKKIIVFVLAISAFVACSKKEAAQPEAMAKLEGLAYRQETSVKISGHDLRVDLNEVLDSRCPMNANCVWAGKVELKFVISDGTYKEDVEIVFGDGEKNSGQATFSLGGQLYELKVSEVLPYPETEKYPNLEDYKVKLTIEKK